MVAIISGRGRGGVRRGVLLGLTTNRLVGITRRLRGGRNISIRIIGLKRVMHVRRNRDSAAQIMLFVKQILHPFFEARLASSIGRWLGLVTRLPTVRLLLRIGTTPSEIRNTRLLFAGVALLSLDLDGYNGTTLLLGGRG